MLLSRLVLIYVRSAIALFCHSPKSLTISKFCNCCLESDRSVISYPSFVTLRVFLLIKSFKETQYQLVEVSVVQIL
jgi:hypothetical protein